MNYRTKFKGLVGVALCLGVVACAAPADEETYADETSVMDPVYDEPGASPGDKDTTWSPDEEEEPMPGPTP